MWLWERWIHILGSPQILSNTKWPWPRGIAMLCGILIHPFDHNFLVCPMTKNKQTWSYFCSNVSNFHSPTVLFSSPSSINWYRPLAEKVWHGTGHASQTKWYIHLRAPWPEKGRWTHRQSSIWSTTAFFTFIFTVLHWCAYNTCRKTNKLNRNKPILYKSSQYKSLQLLMPIQSRVGLTPRPMSVCNGCSLLTVKTFRADSAASNIRIINITYVYVKIVKNACSYMTRRSFR